MENVECILRKLVEKYLSYNLIDTALFYAERLYYENPINDYNLFILATCYYRLGKMKQVYLILQDTVQTTQVLDNKYLFALVSIALDKYSEAEHILTQHHQHPNNNAKVSQPDKLTLQSVKDTPGGANGVFLLGRICRRQHRKDVSIVYYKLCLLMDPYLWCAITELSEMGVAINMNQLYSSDKNNNTMTSIDEKQSNLYSVNNENKYYSVKTLLDSMSSDRLKQFSVAENLSMGRTTGIVVSGNSAVVGVDNVLNSNNPIRTHHTGSLPHVSMSLGLSSMSLHAPFASPSSMPSPYNNLHLSSTNTNNNPNPIYSTTSSYGGVLNDRTFSMRDMYDNDDTYELSSHQNDQTIPSTVIAANTATNMHTTTSTDIRSSTKGWSESSVQAKYDPPRGFDSSEGSIQSHSEARDPRAILFGISTPGLTPIPAVNESILEEDGMTMKWNNGTGQSTRDVSILKSAIDASGSQAIGGGGGGVSTVNRRVSFGPMARLSFSGAYTGDMSSLDHIIVNNNTDSTDIHSQSIGHSGIAATVDSTGSNSFTEEEYPFKVPRTNTTDSVNDSSCIANNDSISYHRTSTETNRNLPHKILSPFPAIHHTTLLPHNNNLSTTADDHRKEYDSQQQQQQQYSPHHTQRKKYGAKLPTTSITNNENIDVNIIHNNDEKSSNTMNTNRLNDSIILLEQLMIHFATAYQMLCLYCCRACINELQKLPNSHFRSALVSQWIGKAYYEMNEYKPATLAFREMLRAEPFRLKGLEILSTALWHLKRDKELCSLAQQVVDVDKLAPETWCVVGNCFSLQKEPDTAIRFFHRAIQIDPRYTYAYTLTGHEQVNNEDLEKAIESFRTSILHNDRHYNAWYGLGSIYYRQERYELAEYHFRRALNINPASSVLHCYLGMALHAQGSEAKSSEALEIINKACEKDHKNPQLHFQRAHILVAIGMEQHLDEALNALHIVEEQVPKEPPVHALLGQVYHRKGNLQKAVWHLNIAMDLDPKEAASLKTMLEHIDDVPME